jgi:hypothetical protein
LHFITVLIEAVFQRKWRVFYLLTNLYPSKLDSEVLLCDEKNKILALECLVENSNRDKGMLIDANSVSALLPYCFREFPSASHCLKLLCRIKSSELQTRIIHTPNFLAITAIKHSRTLLTFAGMRISGGYIMTSVVNVLAAVTVCRLRRRKKRRRRKPMWRRENLKI